MGVGWKVPFIWEAAWDTWDVERSNKGINRGATEEAGGVLTRGLDVLALSVVSADDEVRFSMAGDEFPFKRRSAANAAAVLGFPVLSISFES